MTPFSRRWMTITLVFAGLLGLNILWFIPSPLLTLIMADLHMDLTRAGLCMSIVCLMLCASSLAGGWLIGKLGDRATFSIGLLMMSLGALSSIRIETFWGLFLSRAFMGVGFGFCMPVSGTVIMAGFDKGERAYLNTVLALLPYAATILIFSLTIPAFHWLNQSWRWVMALVGLCLGLVFFGYLLFGQSLSPARGRQASAASPRGITIFSHVWASREMKLLTLAEACDMWGFQFLTAILPTYYTTHQGMSLARSSQLMTLFPAAGVAAGLACGIAMTRTGLRKPFTWPMHLMIFAGTLMAVSGDGWVCMAGIFLAGFGNAGWAPALFTMPMEFAGMTPEKVGVAYAIMLSLGFLSAFISPWLGGFLAQQIGMFATLVLFSLASLVAAAATFMMKETGPGRGRTVTA